MERRRYVSGGVFPVVGQPKLTDNESTFLGIVLVEKPKEHFWAHIAEYPAHDKSIPPALENEFVRALSYGEWFRLSLDTMRSSDTRSYQSSAEDQGKSRVSLGRVTNRGRHSSV